MPRTAGNHASDLHILHFKLAPPQTTAQMSKTRARWDSIQDSLNLMLTWGSGGSGTSFNPIVKALAKQYVRAVSNKRLLLQRPEVARYSVYTLPTLEDIEWLRFHSRSTAGFPARLLQVGHATAASSDRCMPYAPPRPVV